MADEAVVMNVEEPVAPGDVAHAAYIDAIAATGAPLAATWTYATMCADDQAVWDAIAAAVQAIPPGPT